MGWHLRLLFPELVLILEDLVKWLVYKFVCFSAQASEELEERESLAQMAANADDSHAEDGETYIGEFGLDMIYLFWYLVT